jgi:hypothetical protein
VIHQDPVVEGFIPIVQILQNDVFANVGILRANVLEVALDLHVHVGSAGWEEATEAEAVALARFEGCALVVEGVVEDVGASDGDLKGCHELP